MLNFLLTTKKKRYNKNMKILNNKTLIMSIALAFAFQTEALYKMTAYGNTLTEVADNMRGLMKSNLVPVDVTAKYQLIVELPSEKHLRREEVTNALLEALSVIESLRDSKINHTEHFEIWTSEQNSYFNRRKDLPGGVTIIVKSLGRVMELGL